MTLHLYFARRFLGVLVMITGFLSLIYLLLDMVEHIRRYDVSSIGFVEIMRLTLLHMPSSIYQILPLIVILSALFLFVAMARSSELVVVRAAGRSALVTLVAPSVTVLLVGALALTVLNPLSAATLKEYQRLTNQLSGTASSALSVSAEGLWLRQGDSDGQSVIRAVSARERAGDGLILEGVTFFSFDPEGTPLSRIDAASARLEDARWALEGAKIWALDVGGNPELDAIERKVYFVATSLTQEDISTNLTATTRFAIWDLPRVIDRLDQAGFSTRRQRVGLQVELAGPVFLLAMLLTGAAFTMRHARMGRTGLMVLSALLIGFGIYFIRNFAQILGENGQIPIAVAAWTPPIAAILLALGVILNLEDG